MVEQHMVITEGALIGPSDLDPKFYLKQAKSSLGLSFEEFRQQVHREEIDFLQKTLKEAGGNNAEAARRLGITDKHLRHLLKAEI